MNLVGRELRQQLPDLTLNLALVLRVTSFYRQPVKKAEQVVVGQRGRCFDQSYRAIIFHPSVPPTSSDDSHFLFAMLPEDDIVDVIGV